MKKKLLSLLLLIVMFFGIVPNGFFHTANEEHKVVEAEDTGNDKAYLLLNSSYWGSVDAYYTIYYWGGSSPATWPGKTFYYNGSIKYNGNKEVVADYDPTSTHVIIIRWNNGIGDNEGNRWSYFDGNTMNTGVNYFTNNGWSSCDSSRKYDVTYVVDGSSTIESIYGTYDNAPPLTKTATKTGYSFDGWYSASSGGNKVTSVSRNSKVYARFTASKYTITLNNQSATTAGSASVTATYNDAMPIITVPTKTGYIFQGYYSGTNGSGTQYYKSDGTSARTWNIARATTLYAHWKPITYIVTFNSNGGSGSMSDQNMTYGNSVNLNANTFTKEGYSFAGWKDSNGNTYTDKQEVNNLSSTNGDTITLTAIWLKKITVTLNPSGGTVSLTSFYSYQTLKYNDFLGSLRGPLPTPTKPGYTFDGWYYNGTQRDIDGSFAIPETLGDHELEAHWIENTYTLQLNYNDSTNNIIEHILNYTESYTLGSFEREGFKFEGWSTSSTANTPTYTAGTSVSGLASKTTNNESYNLYAVWSKSVTFYVDVSNIINNIGDSTASGFFIDLYNNDNKILGKAMVANEDNENIYYITFNLNNSEIKQITHYQFGFEQIGGNNAGWKKTTIDEFKISDYQCSDFRIMIKSSGPSYKQSESEWYLDLTLSECSYVNYHTIDGKTEQDKIVTSYLTPRFVEKEGYKLLKWYLDPDFKQEYDPKTYLDKYNYTTHLDLYGKYEEANDYYIYVETINLPWDNFFVYMWNSDFSDINGHHKTHENSPWPGSTENITYIQNNIYKIFIDASKSYSNLIFYGSSDNATIKQTIDLELTPDNSYYIFTNETTLNKNGDECYNVLYEKSVHNLVNVQKNTSFTERTAFRFSAGLQDYEDLTESGKEFGFKFIFIKNTTSYVGYWNFKPENMLDCIRYEDHLYESEKDIDGIIYKGFYALTLTDSITFKYSDYQQIIVSACYRDTDGNVQIIKATEYNIIISNGEVYLNKIER